MAMQVEIVEIDNILVVTIQGETNVGDIKKILDQTRNDTGYTHTARLWDFRKSSFAFSQEEVIDLASYASMGDVKPGKVAMLVKEDLSFGVSRIYEVFRHTNMTQVNVFRKKPEAIAWLRE